MGIIPNCPVALVSFSCPYLTKQNVKVVVLDDPPYDVLLGRVPGTISFDSPLPAETSDIIPVHIQPDEAIVNTPSTLTSTCAALTRAQARRDAAQAEWVSSSTDSNGSSPLPTREQFKELQQSCDTLADCHKQAASGKEISLKRGALTTYFYKEGLLHQRLLEKGETEELLVIPKILRPALLQLAHENPLSGHFSHNKTTKRLQKDFYWPGLNDDVRFYCSSCSVCQLHGPRKPAKAPLGAAPLATEPFSRVSVDLVGPLNPPSRDGHMYVLTMVDQATRYPDALPLKRIDSETVAEALMEMFSHVGFPKEITTDNGTQFTSKMFEAFLTLLGTKHHLTPPYHAQSNGLVERFNGTLKTMLRKLTADQPRNWHKHLPALLFAYRDATHAATGFSPFELIFGHSVRGPLSLIKECWISPEALTDEERETHYYVTSLKERLQETCAIARERLQVAHEKSKVYFDKRARMRRLKEGDQVLIFLPTSPKKLLMKWKGPYKVLARLGGYTYSVDINGQAKAYHINLLRKFTARETDVGPPNYSHTGDNSADPPPCESPPLNNTDLDEDRDEEDILSCNVLDTLQDVHAFVAVAMEFPEDLELDKKDPSVPSKNKETFQDCILGTELSKEQQNQLEHFLRQQHSQLSDIPALTSTLEHKIELKDPYEIKLQHSYPIPFALEGTLQRELQKWIELGIVEKSTSPFCSPLLAVKKKDGSHRFCLDCRQLNQQTKVDQEPISDPQNIFAQLSSATWFSKLDLAAGYWQVPLSMEARPLTAFKTRQGLYQFCVMPFGLMNAPATFSRLMRQVLDGLPNIFCYLDDVLVATNTWDEHLKSLQSLFDALRAHNLHAKPSKCEFGQHKLSYLGHQIGAGEVRPLEDRVTAISGTQPPKNKTQLRSFLGSLGYYQKFVKNYAELTEPLTQFLKKTSPDNIPWTDTTLDIFNTLRKILIQQPVLQLPNMNLPFTLQTDASNVGLGAVLLQANQNDPEMHFPVAYASRLLRKAEKNYSTIEKEGLSVYWALQKFHLYLYGRTFVLRTDHRPLLYLNQADKLNPRLKRWAIYINLYSFRAEHIPGEDNHIPDLLSRLTPTQPE